MTELKITIERDLDAGEIAKVQEILVPLITTGALFGVRGGQTIIHFDGGGNFAGIELDYWPFRKRKKDV